VKGLPFWSTPARRARLIQLYTQAADFLEEDGRLVPANNDYIELVIDLWKSLDREEREANWRREKRRLHAQPQIRRRGPFGSIAREIYLAGRPLWRIEAVGVGAFTFKRMARVDIPGLEKVLWVDLAGVELSKNKKRKLLRYKKGAIPRELEEKVYQIVSQAVSRYLAS